MAQSYPVIAAGQSLSSSLVPLTDRDEANRTLFSGLLEPSSPVAYQLWADTTTAKLKQRDSTNTAWVIIGDLAVADMGHLRLDGTNSMAAALDFGTNKGINCVDPTSPQDVATKAYADGLAFTKSYYYGEYTGVITVNGIDRALYPAIQSTVDITQNGTTGVITINTTGKYLIRHIMQSTGGLFAVNLLSSPPGQNPVSLFFDQASNPTATGAISSPCESIQNITAGFTFDISHTAGSLVTNKQHSHLIESIA